ncbi:hypothetical protein QTP70_017190 [Hemibagrus guttatus]|uniref:Uncharacterized protein n=1 Tax=Hemibagrus guttatus TaxID=175788 RepID=A0AAE0Q8L2_9TELE|nr:hypothetical protein QTP70_017190 [Hemibagrus guttatus]
MHQPHLLRKCQCPFPKSWCFLCQNNQLLHKLRDRFQLQKISRLQRPLYTVFHIQLRHHMPKSCYKNNGSSVHFFFLSTRPHQILLRFNKGLQSLQC